MTASTATAFWTRACTMTHSSHPAFPAGLGEDDGRARLPPDYPDDMQPKHRRKERNRSVQQEQPDRRRNGRDDPHEKGKKASRHVFARHGSVLSILRRDRAWRRKGFGACRMLAETGRFAGRVNPAF